MTIGAIFTVGNSGFDFLGNVKKWLFDGTDTQTASVATPNISTSTASVNMFVYDLPNQFSNFTSDQIDVQKQPYIGKIVEAVGLIYDKEKVNRYSRGDLVWVSLQQSKLYPNLVFCEFGIKWKDYFLLKNKGDKIKFMGEISDISSQSVSLEKCELIIE